MIPTFRRFVWLWMFVLPAWLAAGDAEGVLFSDATSAAGIAYPLVPLPPFGNGIDADSVWNTGGAAAGDFDNDGWLDLYLVRYVDYDPATAFTPVAMLALDEFVLWVNSETPYKSVEDYIGAVKKAPPGQFKMGGTGSRQEDQIITVAIEKSAGVKFTYIPFRGGGEVAVQLVGNHVNSTVNNPNEAIAQWRGGKVRPLCVFDGKPLAYTETIVNKMSWSSIPTCKSQGLNMEYVMLRGIFMSPGATPDQVNFYVELFKKVRETPEWKKLMMDGAFNQSFMTGADYVKWVAGEEQRHRELMKEAGFLAKK